MNKSVKANRTYKVLCSVLVLALVVGLVSVPCLAAGTGDVAGAIESTWNAAKEQIIAVTNNVIFPALDMILAILFFVKVGSAYFEYKKHGQLELTAPCILFACLLFTLTAPLYIWNIIG